MPQSNVAQKSRQRRHVYQRKTSSNMSVQSNNSSPVVKKKMFAFQRKSTDNILFDQKLNYQDHCQSRRLRVCDGQRISYEVIKIDSKQKRSQFLQKYTYDPFMRRKFEKSIQRFSRSKSKGIPEKNTSITSVKPEIISLDNPYTTFRQQRSNESQKTMKLINNCKSLMEQLRKNRLIQSQKALPTREKTYSQALNHKLPNAIQSASMKSQLLQVNCAFQIIK